MEILDRKEVRSILSRILLYAKHFIIHAMCKIQFHD